jgi:hypothetical protein
MNHEPGGKYRAAVLGAALALAAAASIWCGWEAGNSARRARIGNWTLETEEMGAFVKSALARGNDLLVVERFSRLSRRDDIAYMLVMDQGGKARLHSDVNQAGKVYTSDYASRALSAGDTLVQMVPAMGLVEVDYPLGSAGVLRAGFILRSATAGSGWMWAGLGLALAALFICALPGLRAAVKL